MASYKVAQDVEAEDKLLGPFSFRQFIYLIIAAMGGIIGYGLSQIFTPLFIVTLPIVVFFLVLALPLRKDQPMEIYLAAIVSFHLKPRRRLWQPDGVESLIEITVPRETERSLIKDLSSDETDRRLEYLAAIADTQGWSVRNYTESHGTSMNSDVYNEAQSHEDIFDDSGSVSQSFNTMISQADASRRQSLIANMQQPTAPEPQVVTPANSAFAPTSPPSQPAAGPVQPVATITSPATASQDVQYNPYPANMRQHVINPSTQVSPLAQQPQAAPPPDQAIDSTATAPVPTADTSAPAPQPEPPTQSTSDTPISPDIISLASNNDLTIETIAREAHRIEQKQKQEDDQEVIISLR